MSGSNFLSIWPIRSVAIRDDIYFCKEITLAMGAMNAEMPPLKNGELNSESASTTDRSLTPSDNHPMSRSIGESIVRVVVGSGSWRVSRLPFSQLVRHFIYESVSWSVAHTISLRFITLAQLLFPYC